MKIAIITEVYHPSINGVVVSIDTFREELIKLGHEVIIFAPRSQYTHSDPPHTFRVPAINIPFNKDYVLSRPDKNSLKLLADEHVDIIHAQHMFSMGKFSLYAGKKLGIPVVHTYHTLIAQYTRYIPVLGNFSLSRWLLKQYLISQSRRFCNQVETLITPSFAMVKVLKSYGIKRKIDIVSTGIDPKEFTQADENYVYQKHKLDKKLKIILYTGRLSPEKSVDLLIKAYAEVSKNYPKTHLILLGSGPQKNEYLKLINHLGLKNYITLPGFVDPTIAKNYFKSAYIFAFPSSTDTQGIVIAEAMAAKTAVVAVNRMGPTDIIKNEKNGLSVEPTVTAMANGINRLLNNSIFRQRLIVNSQETVKELTTQNQTKKLLDVYNRTIDNYKKKLRFID